MIQEFTQAQPATLTLLPSPQRSTPKWEPPPSPLLKINFDGAVFKDKGEDGMGVVVCDSQGKVIASLAEKIQSLSSLDEVEALAAVRAITLAMGLNLPSFIVEGDSEVVISTLRKEEEPFSSFGHLISSIKHYLLSCNSSLIEASSGGFSVDLIHRDSPNSPFYNPSETPSQRIAKAVRRSISLVNRFKPTSSLSTNAAQSDISSNGGEYLLKYSVGTPPVEILGFADTSTDLIWLQCEPCSICYNQTAPIFYPKKSSTYKKASCSSAQCQSLPHSSSSGGNNSSCQYSMDYYDGSSSDGDLAVDTLTLGSTTSRPVPLPKTIIGCGYDNERFTNANGSGVIGLGRGAISLASQPGSSIGGKFSYCLIPFTSHGNTTSKLNFGSNAVVAGSGAVSTPLILGQDSYYYITLEAISVGRKRIDLTNASESGNLEKGNIIINSGITVTSLPEQLYPGFISALKDEIHLQDVYDPTGQLILC
nr:aspartic proteinase CDR1-like [Quercus suber]